MVSIGVLSRKKMAPLGREPVGNVVAREESLVRPEAPEKGW